MDPALHMEVLPRLGREQAPDTDDTTTIADTALEKDLDDIPDGPTFPLNSKRLNATRIRRIAESLDVLIGAAADEVRQMLGEKLRGMGHDPTNVQVVIEGDDNLYVVDNTGIILHIKSHDEGHVGRHEEGHMGGHVTEERSDESLRSALREARAERETLTNKCSETRQQLEEANSLIAQLREEAASLARANSDTQRSLKKERLKSKRFWKQKCNLMLAHEEVLEEKETTIAALQRQLEPVTGRELTGEVPYIIPSTLPLEDTTRPVLVPRLQSLPESETSALMSPQHRITETAATGNGGQVRRGKAPPVDPFTGENDELMWEDWLPTLGRAATWNGWSKEEKLLQLAGYLKGKALQEWNLMSEHDRRSFSTAATKLKEKLDQGVKKIAAQDFRHATQKQKESVLDFIHRLEKMFRRAYGREALTTETRDALLYGQLQEGLKLEIMQAPAVSGSQSYAELCVAAKNEQYRQEELQKRHLYNNVDAGRRMERINHPPQSGTGAQGARNIPSAAQEATKRCFICNKVGHLKKDCRQGRKAEERSRMAWTNQVRLRQSQAPQVGSNQEDPLTFLQSSSDEEVVRQVQVSDTGSISQCVKLFIQGVPVYGIIDSGADITIIGGKLFKRVALAAQLKKKDDKVAQIIEFLEKGTLPYEEDRAWAIVLQQSLFAIVDQALYYIDPKKQNIRRIVVPTHLQK